MILYVHSPSNKTSLQFLSSRSCGKEKITFSQPSTIRSTVAPRRFRLLSKNFIKKKTITSLHQLFGLSLCFSNTAKHFSRKIRSTFLKSKSQPKFIRGYQRVPFLVLSNFKLGKHTLNSTSRCCYLRLKKSTSECQGDVF